MYSHKKPFTCRFSSLLVILFGLAMAIFAHQVMADDYFNPALLDIDNPRVLGSIPSPGTTHL